MHGRFLPDETAFQAATAAEAVVCPAVKAAEKSPETTGRQKGQTKGQKESKKGQTKGQKESKKGQTKGQKESKKRGPPGKRKGAGSSTECGESEVSEVQADALEPAKATKASKAKRQRATKSLASFHAKAEEAPLRPPEEWPEWFRMLERTHRALNLVYTFCCTRKHLLTTFDTIRTAVEKNTGRPLDKDEVAAVAALLSPSVTGSGGGTDTASGIHFAYVDELSLQLDVQGSERDATFKSVGMNGSSRAAKRVTTAGPAVDASVGGISGHETLEPGRETNRWVLYFEFVDEDLKRQVPDAKTGEATKPTRKLRDERLRMPVYGQKEMARLIEKRNRRFAVAVCAFLDQCARKGEQDAAARLKKLATPFVPRLPQMSETAGKAALTDTLPPSIPGPDERKSIAEIVQELQESPWYSGQIVPDGHRVWEAQAGVLGELDFLLSQDLVNALYNAKGITHFYAHQAEAINALHAGEHVVVATSTSSGKSLIFQLPVVHALEADAQARALYLFPTKALAQDQKRSLRELLAYMPGLADVLVETYDGDTPWTARAGIRDAARVIFTNPDMLHAAVLPQEERWRGFLQHLEYVVVDELHYYNGLLGAHMGYILRRLQRLCAALGNDRLRFVSCSATVANPAEHFAALFGRCLARPLRVVDQDGSPAGRKEFLCWNTPFRVPGDPASGRASSLDECARLFCALVLRGVRVIAFCRVREQCEKLVGAARRELERLGRPECTTRVMAYRGGYSRADRRRLETDMFSGRLVGIVATTALELGVDIGMLDAVISWGFPYTMANLRQQSGRAGRRHGRDSLSVLVGGPFATDQYYMENPDALFEQPHGALQVDLDNLLVREGHLQCAAMELPIRVGGDGDHGDHSDERYFGPGLAQLCAERLSRDRHDPGLFHCHEHFRPQPWKLVAIRDAEDDHFAVVDVGRQPPIVLEELEASRATFTLYDGAIFLHQGATYLVRDFRPDEQLARVVRVNVDWTTQQRDFTDVDAVEAQAVRRLGRPGRAGGTAEGRPGRAEGRPGRAEERPGRAEGRPGRAEERARAASSSPPPPSPPALAYLGKIRITQTVFGYFKVDRRERILDAVQVDNPPVVRFSRGTWLDVPASGLAVLARRRLHAAAAIHAAEHAVLGLLPRYVVSLPGDVRTECKSGIKEFRGQDSGRKRPARLTFYDAKSCGGTVGAGSGLCAKAFDFLDVLLPTALARVEHCICGAGGTGARGCPECVVSAFCQEANTVMSKAGAIVVLRSLLGLEIDEEALPMGPEEGIPEGRETIVLAQPVPGGKEVPEEEE